MPQPSLTAGFKRGRAALFREKTISLACRALGKIFALFQSQPPRLFDLPPGAKVLFIKPCCIGDVVLTTPTVAALREGLSQARLEYAVSGWSRQIIENNPRLDKIVDTGVAGSNFSIREYVAFARKLRRERYSAVVVLDRSPLLNLLPWLAWAKIRAGIDSQGRGFALNIRSRLEPGMSLKHEAEVYLDVARALVLNPWNPRLEYFPSESDCQSMAEKAQQTGLDLSRPFAVIHPGGGNNPDTQVLSKRWPAPNFAQIAARLTERGYQVVIIGAPDKVDRELADQLLQSYTGDTGVLHDAVGKFSVGEIGALYEKAALFVGNDTGLMHLAAACGSAVVAVFGPSSPVAYGPYTPRGRAVSPIAANIQAGLPLSEYEALSASQGGIQTVTVEQVWEAVESLLSA